MNLRAILLVLVMASCFQQEPETSETEQAVGAYGNDERLGGNRLGGNRLGGNRLGGNRLGGNRLKPSALGTTNSLFLEDPELDDEDTREFISYVVSCALDRGQFVDFPSSIGNLRFEGELGFAPEWRDGSCGTYCQQKVTGCLLARVNFTGRGKPLSLRLVGDNISQLEKSDHWFREGAFYGNLFAGTDANPQLFFCQGDPQVWEDEVAALRFCDQLGDPECPIKHVGFCDCDDSAGLPWGGCAAKPSNQWGLAQQACSGGMNSDGTFDYCANGDRIDNNPPVTHSYRYAIAAYSSFVSEYWNVASDVCGHADYDTGTPLTGACSLCARKVIREGGTHHRTGAAVAYQSSCNNSSWSQTCVDAARDLCGDHSVCETGDNLLLGDSRCIDDICAADPYCCTSSWDARCVEQATSICELDCTPYHPNTGKLAGNADYCTNDGSCGHGEGDCDTDLDCAPGTACIEDVGAQYGFLSTTDVCVACHGGNNGASTYCSPGCPCQAGEGDCDSDAECVAGTQCADDVGEYYGFPSTYDVCERTCHTTAPGSGSYCTPACPCRAGEADCDVDADCGAGLYCKQDGTAAANDVCTPIGS